MLLPIYRFPWRALVLALPLALGACATPPPAAPQAATSRIAPFASDGCSMFLDRAPIGKADWCGCCLAHDLAYWRGGSAEERLKADQALQGCVRQAADDAVLAETMLAGVRAGGLPYLPTGYRWGYGWPYGRAYEPLSAEEEAQVAQLRAKYMADNPGLACSAPAPAAATASPPAQLAGH